MSGLPYGLLQPCSSSRQSVSSRPPALLRSGFIWLYAREKIPSCFPAFSSPPNRLYQQVKALFANQPDRRFLVFDFRLVTGIDSSAMQSFTQIKQVAEEVGARLVLSISRTTSAMHSMREVSSPTMSLLPRISTAR